MNIKELLKNFEYFGGNVENAFLDVPDKKFCWYECIQDCVILDKNIQKGDCILFDCESGKVIAKISEF